MRALGAALTLVVLGSGCNDDDCQLGQTTGFFDEYKRGGCSTIDISSQAFPFAFGFFPSDTITFTNAPDEVGVELFGSPWVGSRGSCKLFDSDEGEPALSSCEYRVLNATRPDADAGFGYATYTVEVYRAYMAIYGTQGTFNGVFQVQVNPEFP